MPDIVIEVRGGVVTSVYCRDTTNAIVLVDWDHLDGGRERDCVGVMSAEPLAAIHPETEKLIETLSSRP